MSSIPVAGLAKVLTVVTILLHPAAHHGPASYTVRSGDSLSSIAAHAYGNRADWPAVWWANRRQVPNPNVISVGERLELPASGHVPRWMERAAQAAAHARSAPRSSAVADSRAQAPASSNGVNWAAIAACESGGDWSANTGNGFYGGLQFSEGTWLAYGGGQYASSANLASESQQIAVADRVLAGQGIGAWPVCGPRGL
jgi:hypothetical protein